LADRTSSAGFFSARTYLGLLQGQAFDLSELYFTQEMALGSQGDTSHVPWDPTPASNNETLRIRHRKGVRLKAPTPTT
jgi:hypothetical protein